MSSSTVLTSVRRLRLLLAGQHGQEQSDEQLLDAFIDRRDDLAFAALVYRHGPMVLGVCRRVLGHEQDAEDAFQAAFLVLARKAASLRDKNAVAGFLYGAAFHSASKAKRAAGRRRKYEGTRGALTLPRAPVDPTDELCWREVRLILDEEIARLPDRCRSVFILCCLEELSQAEAGRRLGLKESTVANRLAEARKRLSRRLTQRGVELTAVLTAGMLTVQKASAAPLVLMAATIEAALATAVGETLEGVVSASVAELANNATAALMASKGKLAALVLLAASMLTSAGVWMYRGLSASVLLPSAQTVESAAAKVDDKPKAPSPKQEAAKMVEIQGCVFDPNGKPKAGAKLLLHSEDGQIRQFGVSAADGRFTIAVAKGTKNHWLVAQAEDAGIDFHFYRGQLKPQKGVELRLVKDQAIRGRVVNTEGKPVAGASVTVDSILAYSALDSLLAKWKEGEVVYWEIPGLEKELWPRGSKLLATTTDADGRFILHGVGAEQLVTLRLTGAGIVDTTLTVANRKGLDPEPYNRATRGSTPKRGISPWPVLHGPDASLVADSEKPIRGVVKDADSGKGRPNVVVHLTRSRGGPPLAKRLRTTTDAQGRYEMHGVHKAKSYMLEVEADPAAGYMPCQIWADDTAGYAPIAADIGVKKGAIITGKVIDRATGKPIPGFVLVGILNDNPYAKSYAEFNSSGLSLIYRVYTAQDGAFRIVTIPGPVLLMGGADAPLGSDGLAEFKYNPAFPDPKYPQYFRKILWAGEPSAGYLSLGNAPLARGGIAPLMGNFCKVLQIEPEAEVVKQDIVLEKASALAVKIQDGEGRPLSGVWATGISSALWWRAVRIEKDSCSAYRMEAGKLRLMVFYHPERKLAGTRMLKGGEAEPVAVKLQPIGSIKGRLLDSDNKPLAGVVVGVHYPQPAASEIDKIIHKAKQVVTDATGAFAVEELIPEQNLELSFHRGKQTFQRAAKSAVKQFRVKPGERRDFGAIELKPLPERE